MRALRCYDSPADDRSAAPSQLQGVTFATKIEPTTGENKLYIFIIDPKQSAFIYFLGHEIFKKYFIHHVCRRRL